MRPLAIDLFTGLHGWADGLVAEGYRVIGFDLEDMSAKFGQPKPPHFHLVIQDVRTLHGSQFKSAALIVASPPCFVAEVLILTARGLLPIPEVVVGDLVLTHLNRWRRVLRTGSTTASTVIASGYGAALEGTPKHPVYARRDSGSRRVRVPGERWPVYQPKRLTDPKWIPLAESAKCHWGSPVIFDPLKIPPLPNGLPDTPEFWWMVGRWVGDGWLRLRPRSSEIIICCATSEADQLERRLLGVAPRKGARATVGELHWRRSQESTVTRFTAASDSLAAWLLANFGQHASMKSWPAWAFGMEQSRRHALLDGYVSADGNPSVNGRTPIVKTTTVSKRLAIGTRFLAASLGYASCVHRQRRPATYEIEGRLVSQRDSWDTRWTPDLACNRLVDRAYGMQWGLVRRVSPGQNAAQVWNLEVEEDNSYTADGIVVHNCQEYSYRAMPWKRAKALPPPDNELFDTCFRIQREACEAAGRHVPMVVENVKGAQPWVGRARWSFGSFYLWGDVPALMPIAKSFKSSGLNWSDPTKRGQDFTRIAGNRAIKNNGGSWFAVAHNTTSGKGRNPDGRKGDGIEQGGTWWHDLNSMSRTSSSGLHRRKMASAMIARIPLPLSRHIAAVYRP